MKQQRGARLLSRPNQQSRRTRFDRPLATASDGFWHSDRRETVVTTLAGIAVGVAVTLAPLARVGDDPSGGRLVIPSAQAALVLAGAVALGLVGTLTPRRSSAVSA
jgi:hypothetical protein